MTSACVSDEETIETMKEVKARYNYLLDPHGAVGYLALDRYLQNHPGTKGYFLETAHPVKFDVEKLINEKVELPASVNHLLSKKKTSIGMKAETKELKEFLLSK